MENVMLNGAEGGNRRFGIFASWRTIPNDASVLAKWSWLKIHNSLNQRSIENICAIELNGTRNKFRSSIWLVL